MHGKLAPVLLLLAGLVAVPARAADNDCPTEACEDDVFGCMATNGQTQDALKRCSCSIDVMASILDASVGRPHGQHI